MFDTLQICCCSACTQPPPPPSDLGSPVTENTKLFEVSSSPGVRLRLLHPLPASPCCAAPQHCAGPRSATCRWPCTCCRSCPVGVRGGLASRTPEPEEEDDEDQGVKGCFLLLLTDSSNHQMFSPCGLTSLSRSSARSGSAPEDTKSTNINKHLKHAAVNRRWRPGLALTR